MMTTEEQSLTGPQVMQARKRRKLTRKQFSEMCGFEGKSTSRLTTIENRDVWKDGDREKIEHGLAQLKLTEDELTEIRATDTAKLAEVFIGDAEDELIEVIIPTEEWPLDIAVVTREPMPDQDLGLVAPAHDGQVLPTIDALPEGAIRISAGKLASLRRCPRQYWLQWFLELGLRHEDLTSARAIGARIHRALAAYYVPEGQVPSDPRDALERAIVDDWTRLADAIRQGPQSDEVDARLEAVASNYQDVVTLERAMIAGYMEWLAETGVDSELQVIESETPRSAMLEAEVDGRIIPVQVVSLQDTRVIRTTDGVRLFIDHKSTGSLTEPLPMLKADPQMLHYHLVEWLNTPEGEARCDGALYNMLKKVKRTARAAPPFYHREPIMFNTFQIDSYRRELLGLVRQMVRMEDALRNGADPIGTAPKHWTKSCKWECDFYSICPLFDDGSPGVEDMRDTLYQRVDVWARYERLSSHETEGSRNP
jgi:hypothetical protein